MKIVIIGPAYPLRGGIADTNESLCRAFLRQGHKAEIFTFSLQYPSVFFPGKTQFSTDSPPKELKISPTISSVNPVTWLKTARKIKILQPDLIIIRYWMPFFAPALGSIARLAGKKSQIIALTDNVIPHEKRPGDRLLTRYFLGACNAFATLSLTVSKELDQFTRKPKIYFPHPINDNLGEKMDKTQARQELKLGENDKVILFFGLVRRYKGLDLLLEAMADAKLKALNVKLLVVGEFYDDRALYEKQISEHQLGDNVIIDDRYVPSAELPRFFSAADLVAQTYHSASQSGITQIAYHFDVPMVVTDVGGLSEIVKHEKVGYVAPKNPPQIAAAIARFFEQNKAKEFIENIHGEKKKFSWDSFVKRLLALYEKLNPEN